MRAEDLQGHLRGQVADAELNWLETVCAYTGERLLAAFVGAGRRFGHAPLMGESPAAHWPLAAVARVAMVLRLQDRDNAVGWIERAYREGDSGEKLAVVLALPWLRYEQAYLDLALDCGRTNELPLFAALAIGNGFPAAHYSEPAFNSLVMKAAQLDLRLDAIAGLQERANPELARMAMEYIDERQSAGRSYPPSLWLAIAPSCPAGALARMLGELQHAAPARRRGAALALALCKDERAGSFLAERATVETNPEVRAAIDAALERHA